MDEAQEVPILADTAIDGEESQRIPGADESHAPQIAFGPLPDLSKAALPSDVKSQAFTDAIRGLKSSFERREDFSAFLCTQIAARGAVPNTTLVFGLGGWGSKGDVCKDVKAWYAQMARRSAESEIALPAALRRPALQIIEELWLVAARQAQSHIEIERNKAQAAFSLVQQDLQQVQQEAQAVASARDLAERQRDEVARLAQDLRAQLDRAERRHQDAIVRLEADRAAHTQKEESLRAHHASEMQQANLMREQLRDEHQAAMEQIKSSTQLRLEAEVAARAQETSDLRRQIEVAEWTAQTAREHARETADAAAQRDHQMALALDKARQDALSAAQQAFEAQKAQTVAATDLADLRVRLSMLERDLAQERVEKDHLQQALNRASEDLLAERTTAQSATAQATAELQQARAALGSAAPTTPPCASK